MNRKYPDSSYTCANMLKIAIVDDMKDSRELLYFLLSQEYEVISYDSGGEALRHFAERPPDLIILDIRLQGMDGVEIVRRIRQHETLHKLPVIALTANAMSGDRERYLAAGFDEYVSKPIVDIDVFLAKVRRILPGHKS